MNNEIKHSGVVESIEGDCVHVRIVQTSACAACKVASHCNASESKEKIVDVYHVAQRGLRVGDAVTVTASRQVAAHALLLGFGVPFLLMVVVLVVALRLTGSEGMAALSSLVALAPWYCLLYLLRDRISNKLAFKLEQ